MKNCILCQSKITMLNTPIGGKFNDGNRICSGCFKLSMEIDPNSIKKLSKFSIDEWTSNNPTVANRCKKRFEIIEDAKSKGIAFRDVKILPSIINDSENIITGVDGKYEGNLGILVLSDERLIFIDKKIVGSKYEDFPLSKISSISFEKGMIFSKIKIFTSSNVAEISNVGLNGNSLVLKTREQISQPKTVLSNIDNNNDDVMSKLEKLSKLKEAGILTDSEFIEQKTKLLERL